jgi:hypothetical protein
MDSRSIAISLCMSGVGGHAPHGPAGKTIMPSPRQLPGACYLLRLLVDSLPELRYQFCVDFCASESAAGTSFSCLMSSRSLASKLYRLWSRDADEAEIL